jgi:hypothetical protein
MATTGTITFVALYSRGATTTAKYQQVRDSRCHGEQQNAQQDVDEQRRAKHRRNGRRQQV